MKIEEFDLLLTKDEVEDLEKKLNFKYDKDLIRKVNIAIALSIKFKEIGFFDDISESFYDDEIITNLEIALCFRICFLSIYGLLFSLVCEKEGLINNKDFDNILYAIGNSQSITSFIIEKVKFIKFEKEVFSLNPCFSKNEIEEIDFSEEVANLLLNSLSEDVGRIYGF